jgi:uncharacterized protein YbjT (DUF2867 family)
MSATPGTADPVPSARRTVLLTGATGYVGGRLLPALEARGLSVRCLARRPEYLARRVGPATEVVAGDVRDRDALANALAGVDTAYYLVHAMGSDASFEAEEREGARVFGEAARAAGVRRIVYLGGLGRDDGPLSAHLRSRHEVGRILRGSGVPTLELRASIVIGSGSLSFEMIRALVERLPAMITPRWVRVAAQPIAIGDLIEYLLEALDLPLAGAPVIEIGGADRVSYGELMAEYARQRGLRRVMIPVPFLTPRLSSLWLGLVTPLYARVGRKLIDSIIHATEVRDDEAPRAFRVRPVGVRDAIASALRNEDREFAATRWFDAVSSAGGHAGRAGTRFANRILDARSRDLPVPPERAFAPIARIGGRNGWYAYDVLWRARGLADLLIGGVGMRRGRPEPDRLRPGAAIDFWRVEAYEPARRLRLSAEMKLPGRAWLEFEVVPRATGSTLRQTAAFDPLGLGGLLYWYLLYPAHRLIFAGMLAGLARAAVRPATPEADP